MSGLSHTFPDDLDVSCGPGRSAGAPGPDTGGGADVNNVSLTFDDAAAQPPPGRRADHLRHLSTDGRCGRELAGFNGPAPGAGGSVLERTVGVQRHVAYRHVGLVRVRRPRGRPRVGHRGGWSLNILTNAPDDHLLQPDERDARHGRDDQRDELLGHDRRPVRRRLGETTSRRTRRTRSRPRSPSAPSPDRSRSRRRWAPVTSATKFTVNALPPTITSLSPGVGKVGTSVIISGTNFTGATSVSFNGALRRPSS